MIILSANMSGLSVAALVTLFVLVIGKFNNINPQIQIDILEGWYVGLVVGLCVVNCILIFRKLSKKQ